MMTNGIPFCLCVCINKRSEQKKNKSEESEKGGNNHRETHSLRIGATETFVLSFFSLSLFSLTVIITWYCFLHFFLGIG